MSTTIFLQTVVHGETLIITSYESDMCPRKGEHICLWQHAHAEFRVEQVTHDIDNHPQPAWVELTVSPANQQAREYLIQAQQERQKHNT